MSGRTPSNVHSLDPDKKIVFVLGAGFSRPLGGLLLDQLLAYVHEEVLYELFPPRPTTMREQVAGASPLPEEAIASAAAVSAMHEARILCQAGISNGLWSNPEDFLEKLETSHSQQPDVPARTASQSVLASVIRSGLYYAPPGRQGQVHNFRTLPELVKGGRRAMAADCHLFLRGARPDIEERWIPFIRWARGLRGNHTVITFNYDLVPEILAAQKNTHLTPIYPESVDPDHSPVFRQVADARSGSSAPVLKLHGSLNLVRRAAGLAIEQDFDVQIASPDSEFLIGVPGPAKTALSKEIGGALWQLWESARKALSSADIIVFVGYRFPESDAESRSVLLDAIRTNTAPDLLVQTVLGPKNPDAERLAYLLEATVGSADRVEQLPLYAQDYLDIVWKMPRKP
jgi:hypothetical protein